MISSSILQSVTFDSQTSFYRGMFMGDGIKLDPAKIQGMAEMPHPWTPNNFKVAWDELLHAVFCVSYVKANHMFQKSLKEKQHTHLAWGNYEAIQWLKAIMVKDFQKLFL